jgi:hypothetical protein
MNDKTENADKKKFLDELINKQIKNVPIERKLHNKDLRRIVKYINTSIFNEDNCCMWNGYVTNESNSKRGTYVNFFFRNKKVALHRLLYENFVGPLGDDYYLKFSCDDNINDGKCCNINHMLKYKYITSHLNQNNELNNESNNESNNETEKIIIQNKKNNDKKKNKKQRNFINDDLKLNFE